ncbi:MAG TPA: ATP-binding protein [Longimicrobium sp.]|nr:ATP-binding protein [Longimicrobium sp.]
MERLLSNLPGMAYRGRCDELRTLEFASEGCARLTGFPCAALVDDARLPFGSLVHEDDHEPMLAGLRHAVAEGRPYEVEYRIVTADGRERWVSDHGRAVDRAPDGVALLEGYIADVTARKQADEALRRSEQQLLQVQKMDTVGRLASGVAHDFNNLLTAIRGNAELLLADVPPDSPSREDVEEIRRAADRAAALTRQLLAFSRRQVLQARVLDLNDSVRAMERMLPRLLGEDVELVTRLDPALGRVRADPSQVEQVVMNLAVNARDAMPHGGVLVVSTENAVLDEALRRRFPYVVPGAYALLEVIDTGHGMDAETAKLALEPFFTTKAPGKGTGLGLATVYGIVKQSGGYIWLDSRPGRGTSIRVYLPLVSDVEAEADEVRQVLAIPAEGRETVLLVEDEDAVRRIGERVLSRAGYRVLTASTGAEAVAVSRQHPGTIHLLLTDLVMPRMGGRDLARRLVAERPGLRVLYVSGYDRDAADGTAPGDRSDFIEKPFTSEALAEHVRRILDSPA